MTTPCQTPRDLFEKIFQSFTIEVDEDVERNTELDFRSRVKTHVLRDLPVLLACFETDLDEFEQAMKPAKVKLLSEPLATHRLHNDAAAAGHLLLARSLVNSGAVRYNEEVLKRYRVFISTARTITKNLA